MDLETKNIRSVCFSNLLDRSTVAERLLVHHLKSLIHTDR